MSITVDLTYDISKALGVRRLELEGASTVIEGLGRLLREHGAIG